MKFRLVTEHVFDWPIDISVPDPANPGKFLKQKMTGKFRFISRDEAYRQRDFLAGLKSEEEREQHEHDVIRTALIGWNENDVLDEDGQPVPFSSEALEQAIQLHWFRQGVYRAYEKAMLGDGARRGN